MDWKKIVPIITIIILIIVIIFIVNKHKKKSGSTKTRTTYIPANERAGIYGESFVNKYLSFLLEEDESLLNNVLLPLNNGYKTEIDSILVTRKGIFCIETKNWVGHISGNDNDEYWVQKYDDPMMSDKKHLNPVIQNEAHCQIIDRIFKNKYEVFNAVIFVDLEDDNDIDSDFTFYH